jgi:hypothetical protein
MQYSCPKKLFELFLECICTTCQVVRMLNRAKVICHREIIKYNHLVWFTQWL